jgi:uncharacterized protein (DUF488 family)
MTLVTTSTPAAAATLLGWGYEGRAVEDLVRDAHAWGVTVVIDVRLNAISRRHGFSKRALGDHLAAAGLQYVHLRDLGNPRENRAGFAEPGTPAGRTARDRYRREVLDTDAARGSLRSITQHNRAIVLCFEAEERCCHRALVLEAARELLESEER